MNTRTRCLHVVLATWLAMVTMSAAAQEAPAASDTAAVTPADRQAERRVEAKLDARPALQEVEADVSSGVATLSGEVPTQPDRKQASDLAADTPGIATVQNRTELDPDLRVRFKAALDEVEAKLMRLAARIPLLVMALLIVLLSVWLGGVLSRNLRFVKRLSNHNPYMDGLVRSVVRGLVVLGGSLLALDLLGATSLVGAVLGSAGVVGLVLGFAFKDIAENYIAGILLSLRRPFSPGDLVRIDQHEGRVVALTSRTTQLMTVEGNHLMLPNGVVFKSVLLNYTRNPKRRFDFATNVATGRSWHAAMDVGIRTLRGIDGVLDDPAPTALIQDLANDAATLRFMGWIDQHRNDLAKTRSEAMRLVRRALREEGLVPPDGVQRVALTRETGDEQHATQHRESGDNRDTSVDRTLDDQIYHVESADGKDLLTQKPATTVPPSDTRTAHEV